MKRSTKARSDAAAEPSTPASNVIYLADYAHLRRTYERSETPATIIILPVVRKSPLVLAAQG